jgi:hypothetical protein
MVKKTLKKNLEWRPKLAYNVNNRVTNLQESEPGQFPKAFSNENSYL